MQSLDDLANGLMRKITGNKSAVGVDVGTKSIKIVALKKEKGKIILKNYAIARTKESLIKIGQTGVINEFTGNIVKEAYFHSDTTFSFNYMKPAKYKFRVIFDNNGNRQWDTGYYQDKIQPERILFYPKEIEVRANWEVEETWKIK